MPDYPPRILRAVRDLREEGPLPDHLAIIMDGNRRWARRHDVSTVEGHREGVHSARAVADLCGEIEEVEVLTLYAFSTENWGRPDAEIQALMELLKQFLRREVSRMVQQNVRFETLGRLDSLPDSVREELARTKRLTRDNDGYRLNLALNYGGRDELTRAARGLARKAADGEQDPDSLSEDDVEAHLDTAGVPDPDLMIRTSGEKRLSNFLLWQAAYAEMYFTEELWPDFREEALIESLREYQTRDRRFGRRPGVDS